MAQDTVAIDIEAAAQRSHERVYERLSDDAPCKGDGVVLCPFCDRSLEVRRSILGYLDEINDSQKRPHIDGVQLKCAGDDGCAFRPDFDVPIHHDEWAWERQQRGGEKVIDMGYTPDTGTTVQERLRSLGYWPEQPEQP